MKHEVSHGQGIHERVCPCSSKTLFKDRWQARSGLPTSASQCFKRIAEYLRDCFLWNREVLGLEKAPISKMMGILSKMSSTADNHLARPRCGNRSGGSALERSRCVIVGLTLRGSRELCQHRIILGTSVVPTDREGTWGAGCGIAGPARFTSPDQERSSCNGQGLVMEGMLAAPSPHGERPGQWWQRNS